MLCIRTKHYLEVHLNGKTIMYKKHWKENNEYINTAKILKIFHSNILDISAF